MPTSKPMGVGELKVVKQRLSLYEPGEIAHIENVMAHETRKRNHRRLRQIEETTVVDYQREEESKRDLQSTERFELQNETEKTARAETSFNAGLNVSASYGPVQIGASANFSTSMVEEESNKNASKYAKDITQQTLNRLVERVKQERRTRTLEETEEENTHGFENDTDKNATGIYRWVDKYYLAKVINYGKRLMYEFYIPEPAAFYLFATTKNLESNVLPTKPTEPMVAGSDIELAPALITRENYLALIDQEYSVQGVEPPPPAQLIVSKSIAREFQNQQDVWSFTEEQLDIPKGYMARYGAYVVSYTWDGDGEVSGKVAIGINSIDIGHYPGLIFIGESGKVPISVIGDGIRAFAINIEVICDLTSEQLDKWRLNVFSAVMNGYYKALGDYEERLAATQIQQGALIGGNNPLLNREIEKEELKKACMTRWTNYDFDHPSAIGASVPEGYPQINNIGANEVVERMRFLEECFEWTNMTYEFLPYFWGRKAQWVERIAVKSTDPVFEKFLRAGAARVVVPVRPAFLEAVLYYQLTDTIWNGGPVPSISGIAHPDAELYNNYLAELADVEEEEDAIHRDVEIHPFDPETWSMKIPTTLVWLQSDDPEAALPSFDQ